ncbi:MULTISPECIES: YggS family pyridoxal phosphate-dependent enzyme [Ectothiorhodospira]|uniref:YggS family pyridoxal phosphate-dependent enzyme n=1 Tax=Ectothiorhodospira TaxID=1051 RepID=UPI001EE884D3|nr:MULTISPECIES: YggS family pyridoxal phosphate-dependent enzyme [Ectothiorhodospira]MCG5494585.1 YggS family pyridoxal phosphate-dependent enzyme [Ectothiorhodospira variabilis]MCG5496183.1 YggS family pyridoxal phosphate-dependent enzyme [Ectothiorhodospira variabilis]MCG5503576.1 YggS family pyridoxal phosphate-dependent enzyme [Ectothiorhodospira variabilis]MCG5506709.1 YggS family pyridoxal phosphate-dependent enzyme [Ectothiorhodospira variabilis]MCG5523686.1 YggS family pyridoxal phosp
MSQLCDRIQAVQDRLQAAARRFGRPTEDVQLLAVSKTRPAEIVAQAMDCGLREFGENYASELEEKSRALGDRHPAWHFIGPIQSNKTRLIADTARWAHSVDRERIARRLSEQRPLGAVPLNVCLQVNISEEDSKSGVALEDLPALAEAVAPLPGLKLRGLMAIPAPSDDFDEQRRAFARLREAQEDLIRRGFDLDTLSMGMTDDLEAAVAEGATIVRVGTAIFGARG